MSISSKTRLAISRRLSTDEEWSNSPMGELARVLIDTDCVSLKTIAMLFDKQDTAIQRWFTTVDKAGLTMEEKQTYDELFDQLREAITNNLAQGNLPTNPDDTYIILKKDLSV